MSEENKNINKEENKKNLKDDVSNNSLNEKTSVDDSIVEETPIKESEVVETSSEESIPDEASIEEDSILEETPIEETDTVEVFNEKSVSGKKDTDIDKSNSSNDSKFKLPFIIGKKIGMSQIFLKNGMVMPVTIVEAGPCHVSQLKTEKNDGYTAVQLSFGDKKNKNTTKPIEGHFKKAGISPKKYLKEFRYINTANIELGAEINLTQYEVGDFVSVTGYSKGKGFAGHMKRHNFSGGRASHGKNSVMRKAGSVGAGTDPGKVWKGTRMAGRMGNDKITTKNIEVLRLDESKNLIFLRGAVPGPNNKIVYLNKSK